MRTRTATWFICIVKYDKMQENGMQKKVTEQYVVNAMSFSEAEERITEEMKQYVCGIFEIANINPAPFSEIFFDEDANADKWYKAKLQFVVYDENTDKEKKSFANRLVQAGSLEDARRNIDEVMGGTLLDYTICALNETNILDIFEYESCTKV